MQNLRNKMRLQRVSRRQVGSREETSISPTIYRTWRESPSSISVMSGLWDWWRRVREPTENGNVEGSTTVNGTIEEAKENGTEEEEEEEDEKVYAEIEEVLQNMADKPKKNDATSSEDDYDEVRELSAQDSLKAGEQEAEKVNTEDEEEWSEDEEWEKMYNGYSQVPTVSLALDIRTQRGVLREIERVGVPVYEPLPAMHSADARLAPVYSTVIKPQSQRNSMIQANPQITLVSSSNQLPMLTQSDHSKAQSAQEKPFRPKEDISLESKSKSDISSPELSVKEHSHNLTLSQNVLDSPPIDSQQQKSSDESQPQTPILAENPPPNRNSEEHSINPHSDTVSSEPQTSELISQSSDNPSGQSLSRDPSSSPARRYLSKESLTKSLQLEIQVSSEGISEIPSPKPPSEENSFVSCMGKDRKVSRDRSTLSLPLKSSSVSPYQSSLHLDKKDDSAVNLSQTPLTHISTKPSPQEATEDPQSNSSSGPVEQSPPSKPSTEPEPPEDHIEHLYCDAEKTSELELRSVNLKPPPPLPTPDWEEGPEKKDPAWRMGKIKRMKKWIGDSKVTTLPNRLSKMLSQDYLCHQE